MPGLYCCNLVVMKPICPTPSKWIRCCYRLIRLATNAAQLFDPFSSSDELLNGYSATNNALTLIQTSALSQWHHQVHCGCAVMLLCISLQSGSILYPPRNNLLSPCNKT